MTAWDEAWGKPDSKEMQTFCPKTREKPNLSPKEPWGEATSKNKRPGGKGLGASRQKKKTETGLERKKTKKAGARLSGGTPGKNQI